MHWYNPKTRSVEDTSTPSTDEEATKRLRSNISSEAFLTVYDRLRAEGMAIEQALIFVGHHFRLRHLEYRPSRGRFAPLVVGGYGGDRRPQRLQALGGYWRELTAMLDMDFGEHTLQHHLALTYTATSISGAVRPVLGIFVTLLLVNTYAASSVQQVIAHK